MKKIEAEKTKTDDDSNLVEDGVEALRQVRRHPERYHPITKDQFGLIDPVKLPDGTLIKPIGWSAGIALNKPWFACLWTTNRGAQWLECQVSIKNISQSEPSELVDFFAKTGVFQKSPNFELKFAESLADFADPNKDYNAFISEPDEGQNGKFFDLTIKITESEKAEPICSTRVRPLEELTKFNREYQKKSHPLFKSQKPHISTKYLSNTLSELTNVRVWPKRFLPITEAQWLDFTKPKTLKLLNQRLKKLQPSLDSEEFRFDGMKIGEIKAELARARAKGDQEAIEKFKDLEKRWQAAAKFNQVLPKIEIKKVLGWNMGTLQEFATAPWFSICYEDGLGRIMMCAWLYCPDQHGKSNAEVISFFEHGNHICSELENFVTVIPCKDRERFTVAINRITELSGEQFYLVNTLIQDNKTTPCGRHAVFCPIEELNRINQNAQVAKRPINKFVATVELTNRTLESIKPEDIAFIYYHEDSASFTLMVKNSQQKKHLVNRSKNIFVDQRDFTMFRGNYHTQRLLPDVLMARFSELLDDEEIRIKHGTSSRTFALDGLSGFLNLHDWYAINFKGDHIILAPWVQDEYLEAVTNSIILHATKKELFSNFASDMLTCWEEIIKDYAEDTTEVEDAPTALNGEIIAYTGLLRDRKMKLVVEEPDGIKIYHFGGAAAKEWAERLNRQRESEYTENDEFYDWGVFADGDGYTVYVREDYRDTIFTPARIRAGIIGLKIKQRHELDPVLTCKAIMRHADAFFTRD